VTQLGSPVENATLVLVQVELVELLHAVVDLRGQVNSWRIFLLADFFSWPVAMSENLHAQLAAQVPADGALLESEHILLGDVHVLEHNFQL